jgi:hypothetical protein
MQVSLLAIYLTLFVTQIVSAQRLPEAVVKNCSSCHDYLSSSVEFTNSRFVTTHPGRKTFVKALDYMPPEKKLSANDRKEIENWFTEIGDKFPIVKPRKLSPQEVAYRCYQTFYNGREIKQAIDQIKSIRNYATAKAFCKVAVGQVAVDSFVLENFYKFLNGSFPSYNLAFNNQDWGSFEVYDMSQVTLGLLYSLIADKQITSIFHGELYTPIRNRVAEDKFLLTRQYNKYFYQKKNLKYFYGEFENSKTPMIEISQVPKGSLVGIHQGVKSQKLTQRCFGNNLRKCEKTAVHLRKTIGAGVLGDPAYFLANNGLDIGEKPNADIVNHRRWVNRVMGDFLCRKLPVIKNSLAQKYVKKNSNLSFRRSKECMSCHVTLDGLAQSTSHLAMYYNNIYAEKVDLSDEDDLENDIVLQFSYPSAFKEETSTLLAYDSLTSKKTYHEKVTGLQSVANFLSQESDFYYCQASRFIELISGEKIDILSLSKSEYRPIIESFKKHRRLKKLLEDLVVQESLEYF